MILRPLFYVCLPLPAVWLWGILFLGVPEPTVAQDEPSAETDANSKTEAAPETEANRETESPPRKQRLFEQEPYDVILLDRANDNEKLKVLPLKFPGRKVPGKLPTIIKVRFVDRPDQEYDVDTSQVLDIQLFEDLILKVAKRLTREKNFDEAYHYFSFLQINHPNTEGLTKAQVRYLFMNGKALYQAKKTIDAMSIFAEALRLSPNNRTVARDLLKCVHEVMLSYVSRTDYRSAQRLLDQKKAAGNPVWQPLLAHWEEKLNEIAVERIRESQRRIEKGEYREARRAVQEAIDVWPHVDGGKQLAQQLARQYPLVVVGVNQPYQSSQLTTLANWAKRRGDRLLLRRLVEFQGTGVEGGDYYCPWGTLGQDDAGTTLSIELRGAAGSSASPSQLTSYDVSRRLLSLADSDDAEYRATWAGILRGVTVHDVRRLDIQLRSSYVRPEALLRITVEPPSVSANDQAAGPYRIDMQSEEETVYISQPEFALARRNQVREIVERRVDSVRAISRIKRGTLDVVDRLEPVQLSQLQGVADVVVQRYEVPTIHVLLPNTERNPFLASDTFRRALVYGIQRENILKQLILAGEDIRGCEVLSGPFPVGFGPDDPLGYASNPQMKPRPYRPRMAVILFRVATNQVIDAAEKLGQPVPELKPLVLAHPDTGIARIACRAIVEQLKLAKLECTLKTLPPGVALPDSEEYDLLYMEWFVSEPIVDGARLFGPQGLVPNVSPFLAHSIRQLDKVTNWREARQLLHKIHETVYNEAPIVPLWQIAEHFAYNRRIRGLNDRTANLYQNVEDWQIGAP